ncbi:phosphopentomutase [Candidatus Annandia pinicola]|uniref:phosphopentomutase n=1 Tax=Candidatus Annandia pinicola TaxID=1345117 RepID=UPI001D02049F|nr:phosphopentomutase [Candidatus Annandia pinicola]UDG80390.1 Phosphopentomutase [Candidatus Annandia pinicola]
MKRLILIVIDSLGIGYSPDSIKFNDIKSNTLGNIINTYNNNIFLKYNNNNNLYIPNLLSLGLGETLNKSKKKYINNIKKSKIISSFAYSNPISTGKDTVSGHWEISGIPILFNWYYLKKKKNSIPNFLLDKIIKNTNVTGYLGNCHSSGIDIINRFGIEHLETKKPIIYTSNDSVLQIACHESIFDNKNLYNICIKIKKILYSYNFKISRIIARPFKGNNKYNFKRTNNRKDFIIKLKNKTVMQKFIKEKKGKVIAIGKMTDIYPKNSITKKIKSFGINNLFNKTIKYLKKSCNNTIICTNFVDFDSIWGHRRNTIGYGLGLELFDIYIPKLIKNMNKEDLLIITSDHGCDTTWFGYDHTRENIPILIYKKKINNYFLGRRSSFSDIGQTISKYFNLSSILYGNSII